MISVKNQPSSYRENVGQRRQIRPCNSCTRNRFIETGLERLKQLAAQQEKRSNDIEVLSELFRELLVHGRM